jgi:hypothetical protein
MPGIADAGAHFCLSPQLQGGPLHADLKVCRPEHIKPLDGPVQVGSLRLSQN